MKQNKFYLLYKFESTRKRAGWAHGEMDFAQVICPVDEGHMRAGKRLMNLSIELPKLPVDDFVWTWYSECLIQDHVLKLFRKHNVTGFEVKPVKARFKGKTAKTPPKLWELIVTGWAGIAPPESGIKLDYKCEACGYTEYTCFNDPRALIKESQWDGRDIFMVWPLPLFIFMTDRVAGIIRDNNLKGVRIMEFRKMTCEGSLSPGRLSYRMPEERARELGGPLGIY